VGPPGERPRRVPPAPQPLGVARIVVVAPELLLGTRVSETLTAVGHDVTLSPSVSEAPLDSAELLIADLERENPEAVVGLGIPVLGYYPHTDAELRETAEAAGVDLVVPRSRLVREMPQLVERLLASKQ
jgi:hypothetical protein